MAPILELQVFNSLLILPHSLSSTSTPALVKFSQNDESLEDEANATINESELVKNGSFKPGFAKIGPILSVRPNIMFRITKYTL